ncbi:MAG: hypothetical protein IPQ16_10915 [Geobacteraceae bacterium]|nr:hypothetical protein [Geobacteraceae bacterium]
MKTLLIVPALLLITGTALAGGGYDACVKEERTLKTQEAAECSGLRYILNPSACFATRKKVKEFAAGMCGEIIRTGKVKAAAEPAVTAASVEKRSIVPPAPAAKTAPISQSAPLTMEQLNEENSRLKTEIGRLNKENEQLRNR